MRSHFLKDLSIDGKQQVLAVLPNFDFYNLRQIMDLRWTSGEGGAEFALAGLYESHAGAPSVEVVLHCSGVSQLKLPELGPSFLVSEVEIEEISGHQIEDVRYRVRDFGESSCEVLCRGLSVSVRKPETEAPYLDCAERGAAVLFWRLPQDSR